MALFLEQTMNPSNATTGPGSAAAENGPLPMMAQRIARNREVMGLHYPSDSYPGKKLADYAFALLLSCPSLVKSQPGSGTNAPNSVNVWSPFFSASGGTFSATYYSNSLFAFAEQEWP